MLDIFISLFSKRAKTKVHKIKWTFNILVGMDSLTNTDVSYQHLQTNFPLQCNRNAKITIMYATRHFNDKIVIDITFMGFTNYLTSVQTKCYLQVLFVLAYFVFGENQSGR